MLKVIVLMLFGATSTLAAYNCNAKSTLLILKRPTYEFSVKLLDRVAQETDGHFVFSPISTYMQLLTLAEGANGETLREIQNVTRHHRLKCFRRKWKWILNRMDAELAVNSKRKSLIVMDRLMNIKKRFIREIKRLKSMDVLLLNFNFSHKSADVANKLISSATSGVFQEAFIPDDFNSTVLLMVDTLYYSSDWQVPFNPVYTSIEPFYSEKNVEVGDVKMMSRADYFFMANIPRIGAKVLELPCGTDNKMSILVFLPVNSSVTNVFYSLQRIRLTSIFHTFKLEKKRLVNVKLPRFNIRTDIDNIPELIYDMGVKRIFHPNLANLRGISDFKMYASLMSQIADIEMTEKGVRATAVADFLVKDQNHSEFIANKPFAFMLVDRHTEIILFAGRLPISVNERHLTAHI